MSYAERLKICHLTTLHFRRLPVDMIDTYKIITGKYDNKAVSTLKLMGPSTTTRTYKRKIKM